MSTNDSSNDIARRALIAILIDGQRAVDVVATSLRGIADNATRKAIKDEVFGIAVLRLRLAHRLGRSSPFVVDDVAALRAAFATDAGVDDDDPIWPGESHERIAARRGMPRWLVDDVVAARGVDDADAFFAACNKPGPVTLRVNSLRTTRASLRAALLADGIVTVDTDDAGIAAVDVVGHANLFGSSAFRGGLFEVQDHSSQVVIARAQAKPGDVVVDLCAGRGGKTLGLAAAMQNAGRLIAHDVDARALRDLRGRLGRSGVDIVDIVDDAGAIAEGSADVVVVDAPCSSSGVLRRSPDLRFTVSRADIDAVVPVQRALLERAGRLVRDGGRVVYATCSVLRAENDDVVDAAPPCLREERREHLGAPFTSGDGFFVASFVKR